MQSLNTLLTGSRDWWHRTSNRSRIVTLAVLALVIGICSSTLPFMGEDETDNDIVVDAAQTEKQEIEYEVQPGDSIISTIAPKHNVPWEQIMSEVASIPGSTSQRNKASIRSYTGDSIFRQLNKENLFLF